TMFLPGPREGVVVRRILSDNEVSLPYPGNGEALQHNRVLRASGQVNANDVPMASMSLAEDVDTTYRDAQLSARLRGSDKGFEASPVKVPLPFSVCYTAGLRHTLAGGGHHAGQSVRTFCGEKSHIRDGARHAGTRFG